MKAHFVQPYYSRTYQSYSYLPAHKTLRGIFLPHEGERGAREVPLATMVRVLATWLPMSMLLGHIYRDKDVNPSR